jgi:hypothetical protein
MGVAFSTQVAAWVVERILDLLMILVIFGIALTQIGRSSVRPSTTIETILQTAGATAGIVGLFCLVLLLGLQRFRGTVQSRLLDALQFLPQSALLRVRTFLGAFAEGMQATRRKSFAAELMVYTMLEWVIIAGSFYCLLHATPATTALTFTDTIIVLGFITLGSVVQIPGVGGGMQVVTVLVLTQFYGIGLEAASGVALLWWVIGFMTIVPIGLLVAFFEGIKWRTLKDIASEDEMGPRGRGVNL